VAVNDRPLSLDALVRVRQSGRSGVDSKMHASLVVKQDICQVTVPATKERTSIERDAV
jgi:hypothetical protein